ncbi:SNF2 family N-terminal domain-containing protein [Lineolata rhizophorae]|uniref:SNF2 family N-terminal domain-containing protein n=1 Tax=Lineolata rhizophorae TaxID=578093 RepID=A0A6A6NS38_9PEZI|nr:SNF2 family N-terminal domain-containing protein [Lineolata rhizophorae]
MSGIDNIGSDASDAEIESEIQFTHMVIDTLLRSSDGYERSKKELEEKVARLEGVLRDRRGHPSGVGDSTRAPASGANEQRVGPTTGVMSPVPVRKHRLSSLGIYGGGPDDDRANKSRRTTPSRPSSSSSLESLIDLTDLPSQSTPNYNKRLESYPPTPSSARTKARHDTEQRTHRWHRQSTRNTKLGLNVLHSSADVSLSSPGKDAFRAQTRSAMETPSFYGNSPRLRVPSQSTSFAGSIASLPSHQKSAGNGGTQAWNATEQPQHPTPLVGSSWTGASPSSATPGRAWSPSQSPFWPDSFSHLTHAQTSRGRTVNQEDDLGSDNETYYDAVSDQFNTHGSLLGTVQDPEETRKQINNLLSNIRPDEEIPSKERVTTPIGMAVELMEHQKLGLTWLQQMEASSNKGGVLADDMGLGKTIQMLSLILSKPSEDPIRKTTLILAPVALLKQWELEILTKIQPGKHALKVCIHHGNSKKFSFKELRMYDVVLTTYGTVASELKRKEHWSNISANNPKALPGKKYALTLIGNDCKWYRVILDEAQCIKNPNSKSAKAAFQLQALSRFCLTGTPMMNSVNEFQSLLQFLRIRPFNSPQRFDMEIYGPIKKGSMEGFKKLQAVVRACLLRRHKDSTIDGKRILNLPPRTIEIKHAVFNKDEKKIYEALRERSVVTFNRYLKKGHIRTNYMHVLLQLLRLRQACCHPRLLSDFVAPKPAGSTTDELVQLAKELSSEVVERIKTVNGAFECPVCFDAISNPTIFVPCGHNSCAECLSKIIDPAAAIARGNEEADTKCPQCRSPINPKRVTDYNSFKKAHPHESGFDDDFLAMLGFRISADTTSDASSDEEDDSEESDNISDNGSPLGGFIVPDDVEDSEMDSDTVLGKKSKQKKRSKLNAVDKKGRPAKQKGKGAMNSLNKMSLADLKKESSRNQAAKKGYLKRLRRQWYSSAKIDKVLEILRDIQRHDPSEKVIVFSQFTTFLDLVEVGISEFATEQGIAYQRYDGGMTATARTEAVFDFMENARCKLMLVSLKAGNAGLNLTRASQVIILDPFWNPYVEEQAIDRAHRIGQTRPVLVHRILVKDTVEDRILEIQEQKREMVSTALDEGADKSVARLDVNELAYLFGASSRL